MNTNSYFKELMTKLFNLKLQDTKIPDIVPVLDVARYQNVCEYKDASGVIYTVPSTGKFYLHAIELSTEKAAANTGVLARVDVIPSKGKTVRICQLPGTSGVAQSRDKVITGLNMQLDPGTNISLTLTGTYASQVVVIYGAWYPD